MQAKQNKREWYNTGLLVILFLLMATGCTDEMEPVIDPLSNELLCSVSLPTLMSKGLVSGTSLPNGSTIGVYLTDQPDASDPAYQKSYFTAYNGESGQSWKNEGTPLLISSQTSTAYAYFPYRENVDDIRAIPVRMEDQTDLLVATPVTGITRSDRQANFQMKHMFSVIRLRLSIGDYSGAGELKSYSIQGDHLAASAKVNATSGNLFDYGASNDPYLIKLENPIHLSDIATELDMIVIPKNSSGKINLELQVDGLSFRAELESEGLVPGRINSYEVLLRPQRLSVSPVEVTEWEYPAAVSQTLLSGYAIQMTGNMSNVAVRMAESTADRMVIKAVPLGNSDYVQTVDFSGNGTFQQELDMDTGIRTITLEEVTSDVVITFNNTWYYLFRVQGNTHGIKSGNIYKNHQSRTFYAQPTDGTQIVIPPVVSGGGTVEAIRYVGLDCLVDITDMNGNVYFELQGTRLRTECLTVGGNSSGLTYTVTDPSDGTLLLRIIPDNPNNVARMGSLAGEGEIVRNRYLANGVLEVKIQIAGDCTYQLDGTDTPATQAWSDVTADGVYYVAANGAFSAEPSLACQGVALVNQATGQKIMIEKFEDTNDAYKETVNGKAVYHFRWSRVGSDLSIPNKTYALGKNASGYLGGSLTPQLSQDPSQWTDGALGDFAGVTNTNALVALSQAEDNSYTITLTTLIKTLRASEWGMGHTDWIVPSAGQLALILLNYPEINAKLEAIGGQPIYKHTYWSSTEQKNTTAYVVSFDASRVVADTKTYIARCRLVRMLNE